jgi:O-antigen/teichoic acid export membrane protein
MTLGSDFIGLWMGAEFAGPAGKVLFVLGLTQLLSAPHHIISGVLYGMSKHRIIAILRFCEAIANVALSIILVRWLGLVGVALGTAISHLIVVLLILPQRACKAIGIDVRTYLIGTYGRTILAAVPMALAAVWLGREHQASGLIEFFAQIAGLVSLYAVSVYFIALSSADRELVKRAVRSWAPA